VDLERLAHERMRQTSFGASAARHRAEIDRLRTVRFELGPRAPQALQRRVERYPYVPADTAQRDARCREVYDIQVSALAQRLQSSGIAKLAIGVSGGLDSTHALLVCAQAMDRLALPRSNILGVTMPGYATSERTREQARRLMAAVGCEAREIDIRPSCDRMLADIGHPHADGVPQHDITFENVQAGERTSHLFRLANFNDALVVGTGDLSELALGWCTYGVGDHMSHYNVNGSVPKTLIKHLVRWVAETQSATSQEREVLLAILATEISPELVPGDAAGQPGQSTEDAIGPYDLHDFSLYYTLRFGFAPSKVAFLAHAAWADATAGAWPEGPHVQRRAYTLAEIKRHLKTFVWRFFKTSQFKRSCLPNAPKVGSGGSLSPRGDWRAPSDGEAAVWLAEMDRIPD
jgi:NAD+ synthase (glutamine-hydrolysing)